MGCPERELLSAYFDREANPSEEKRVDLHLADCASCRAALRLLGRMKAAARNQPLPPMPDSLRRSLREAAAGVRPSGPFAGLVEALAFRPAWAFAAAAACAAFLAWSRPRPPETVVPVDMILAAHNQYQLTMPLASTEQIMSELPLQISRGGPEEPELGDAY